MKYIITEDQLEKIKNSFVKLRFEAFGNNWDLLQHYIKKKGILSYSLVGDLDLSDSKDIVTLGSIIELIGNLDLSGSLIEDLGDLKIVGGKLNISRTPIRNLGGLTYIGSSLIATQSNLMSLGELTYVGKDMWLKETPFSKKANWDVRNELRKKMIVLGSIFLD